MRALVIAGIVLIGLAGCKAKPAPDPTVQPPILSPALSPPPTPATSEAPPPAPDCDGSVSGGSDPHRAVIRAWLCRQTQTHVNDAARDDLAGVPRDINMTWTFVNCDGTAGAQFCTYRNGLGSDLVLRVPASTPQTITEVRFQRTVFHNDSQDYTRHFIEAWIGRNFVRMRALSSAAIASFAESHTAPLAPWSLTLSPAEVWIYEVDSATADYRIVLQGQLGRANAVTELHPL